MAGMIYDANDALNWILKDPNMKEAFRNSGIVGSSVICNSDFRSTSSKSSGRKSVESNDSNNSQLLSNLFSDDEERELLGIAFFTIFEAGVVVSGYAGTGIVLSRNIMTGEWSGPVAVGVTGVGAGLLLGASIKTIVYLIYDYFTLKSIIGTGDGSPVGVIFGLGAGATIGTWTKDKGKQSAYITSPKMLRSAGIGSNVALCRGLAGAYGAVSVEAGLCRTRDRVNARFYGRAGITGSDVLLSGEKLEIPNSTTVGDHSTSNFQAKRLLEKIHTKLERLCNKDGSGHDSEIKAPGNNNDGEEEEEDVQASLEELYADESFDNVDDTSDISSEEIKEIILPLKTSPTDTAPSPTSNASESPVSSAEANESTPASTEPEALYD